jgi:hypothetical protein
MGVGEAAVKAIISAVSSSSGRGWWARVGQDDIFEQINVWISVGELLVGVDLPSLYV